MKLLQALVFLAGFQGLQSKWPVVINNYDVKNLYHCIYIFFICTDHIGTWPANKHVCIGYFKTCLDVLQAHNQENDDSIALASSCHQLKQLDDGVDSGTYTLNIGGISKEVYCDMDTLGGGWTVMQRRGDFGNPVDYFLRNWTDYKDGFGDPDEDFWLGLDSIHAMTKPKKDSVVQLMITLADFDGGATSLIVNNFTIGSEQSGYRISYKNYNSRIGNSMPARGTKFSTVDKDNDAWSRNCAKRFSGAWWYSACHNSNLNGLYLKGEHESFGNGVNWYHFKGYHYSLKETEMKIREVKPRS